MEKQQVTKNMVLGMVVLQHPQSAKIMLEYGLHCVGCKANTFDTIENGSKLHGLTDTEIDEMVSRINDSIELTII